MTVQRDLPTPETSPGTMSRIGVAMTSSGQYGGAQRPRPKSNNPQVPGQSTPGYGGPSARQGPTPPAHQPSTSPWPSNPAWPQQNYLAGAANVPQHPQSTDPAIVAANGGDTVQPPSAGASKFLPIIALGALIAITFLAPWISYDSWGVHLTLGGTITPVFLLIGPSQTAVWGLVFAGVCVAFAIWIMVLSTADDVGACTFLAGAALFVLVLATWIGRSVWSDVPLDDPHMAWGYWVSLALTIGLVLVGAVFMNADSDD